MDKSKTEYDAIEEFLKLEDIENDCVLWRGKRDGDNVVEIISDIVNKVKELDVDEELSKED